MTKLEGATCPQCGSTKSCYCRCNFCHEQFNKGWKNNDGQQVMNPYTGKPIPHDMHGNPHNKCMLNRKGKDTVGFIKGGEFYVNEKRKDLGDYMKNMARLGADGWWHLWVDGKYRGPVEYAPNDHKSWNGEVI